MSYPEALSELTNYPKALSHAGSGGNVSLKTINIKNSAGYLIELYNFVIDGQMAKASIENGATAKLLYVEPKGETEGEWYFSCPTGALKMTEEVTGVYVDNTGGVFNAYIYGNAADDATIELIPDDSI